MPLNIDEICPMIYERVIFAIKIQSSDFIFCSFLDI